MVEPSAARDDPAPEQPPPQGASMLETLQLSLRNVWSQWLGIVDLAALEARLAALTMVEMAALALAAALFAITAWWLVLAAIAAQLVAFGVPMAAALVGIGVVNLLLAYLAINRARKLAGLLSFDATRTALGSGASAIAAAGSAPTEPEEDSHAAAPPPPAQA